MRNILLSKVGGQVRFVGNCRLTPQMWSRCTSRTYFYYYLDHDDSDDYDEDDYDDHDIYIMPECVMYLSHKKVTPRIQGILLFLLFPDTFGKGWKVRRLEGWKIGSLEGWKVGRLEGSRGFAVSPVSSHFSKRLEGSRGFVVSPVSRLHQFLHNSTEPSAASDTFFDSQRICNFSCF